MIAEVSQRLPLDDWKIGPTALDQWEAEAGQLMLLEAAIACYSDSVRRSGVQSSH